LRRILLTFFLILLSLPYVTYAAGGLEVVSVQTEGRGKDKRVAIDDALVQAISQVNGVSIASQAKSALAEVSASASYDLGGLKAQKFEANASASAYAKMISSKTNGLVKSWRIISETKEEGSYLVKLSVEIAKYSQSEQAKRLRLAVVPFRISKNIQDPKSAKNFENNLGTELENYLTQTRRFAMLDRAYLLEQSKELAFIQDVGMSTDELAKIGNRLGTDYLIVGTIEKSATTSSERKSRVSDKVVTSSSSSAKVTFRIIDVPTTQVKFAETFTVNEGDLESSATSMAKKIGNNIVESIYPIRIISVNADGLILGQGGNTVNVGQKFNVYQLGKPLKDPYTGESLGQEELEVALIEITKSLPKMSNAKIIDSKTDVSKIVGIDKLIVRPYHSNGASVGDKEKKPNVTKKDKTIEKLEKESEKEW
jgi:curli biogenesis system outer membrane secretion channel CsgG